MSAFTEAPALPFAPFDVFGPLPEGTTVLEASAGTGKTYTIAALVTRYLAEGVTAVDGLLAVSFSRESTRELRERVRERLVRARDGLAATVASTAPDAASGAGATSGPSIVSGPGATREDGLVEHLRAAPAVEVAARLRRLEQALADFDAATVTTTHGFCQQILNALGTAADHDADTTLVEDVTDLVTEVADDLYLGKWAADGAGAPAMTRRAFGDLAREVALDPATPLVPDPREAREPAALRARVAAAVRAEVGRRKARGHLLDYDDLLLRLQRALTRSDTAAAARERLRERYRVVLVDEFQDTDPVQWSILREAFHDPEPDAGQRRALVLIGDPKQAIYGFRGADVHAYLAAREVAGQVATLTTNWRADAALLTGLDAVLGGAALGDPRIRVAPVHAAHREPLLDAGPPVRLRVLPRDDLPLTRGNLPWVSAARECIADDVAAEAARLLASAPTLRQRDGRARPLTPGDVAVLVRRNSEAELVQRKLREAGVPAVLTGRSSVFAAPAAAEWQVLLEALEQPHRTARVRRLALGRLVGLDAAGLDTAGDAFVDELSMMLRAWARVLTERGVEALFERVCLDRALLPALLSREDGERLVTDLRHLTSLLHEAALAGQLGLTALLTWLRRRRDEARAGRGGDRSRRLESDAAAVQVITAHTSKGLEFPVVLVPFAWNQWAPVPETACYHDEAGQRVRDVGGQAGPDWAEHLRRHEREELDNELRLAYVALTRAQSRLVLWWAPTSNTARSPLQRLLLHDDPATVAPAEIPVPPDAAALAAFGQRAARSDGALVVEVLRPARPPRTALEVAPAAPPELARLERPLDTAWRRTSYSALTALAHETAVPFGGEAGAGHTDDEPDGEDAAAGDATAAGGPAPLGTDLAGIPSPWDALPGGRGFGTAVHALLESATDAAPSEAAVRAALGQAGGEAGLLADALTAAMATPLGPLAGGRTLLEVAPSDRLAELEFELPLAGGDSPAPAGPPPGVPSGVAAGVAAPVVPLVEPRTVADLAASWRRHCPDGPLAGYADALAGLAAAPLRGYLTGSIDAVLRISEPAGPRYVVVDYKTNRLAPRDEPLTAWHYRQEALAQAMIEAHYPLQALLYQVALHRYLRWRQPGYDPARHLGGALYLFLRGMLGPGIVAEDGVAPGVFGWQAPADLVVDCSELLAGRA